MNMAEQTTGLDEAELVRRGHAGDREALQELLRMHERGLYAFVNRFVGGAAEAADVYQDIVLRAIENIHRYNPNLSFRTWLYTLAANYCKNVLRSRGQRGKFRMPAFRRSGHGDEIDVLATAPDPAPGPDRAAESSEFLRALERELMNLPAAQREVFVLREFNGVPFREISSILKIPEATARSRMYLAVEYLRVRLRAFAGAEAGRKAEGRA